VIGLQLETSVNSETAQVEDRVEARVTRDVKVDGDIAVPAGALGGYFARREMPSRLSA